MNNISEYPINSITNRRILGRTGILSEKGLPLFWSGSGIELNVKTKELWALFDVDYSSNDIWLCVYVNGRKVSRFMAPKGENWICLIRGFDGTTEKDIEIFKDTQPMGDDKCQKCILKSISISKDGSFCPLPEKKLNIEFIGDSITSGEGLAGSPDDMDWISAWITVENNYAMQVKRKLDADVRILSQCGWGIVHSYDGVDSHSMPPYYQQVCGFYDAPHQIETGSQDQYDFSSWQPHWIVVNLGVNDFTFYGDNLTEEGAKKISAGAEAFLETLRRNNPDAKILWVYGMLNIDNKVYAIKDAIESYKDKTGDSKVFLLKVPGAEEEKTEEDKGSRGHPGPLTHRRAADLIARIIGEN